MTTELVVELLVAAIWIVGGSVYIVVMCFWPSGKRTLNVPRRREDHVFFPPRAVMDRFKAKTRYPKRPGPKP